jgi:ABC-type bacteriocin/lantibiotic exporter with double-glycine peptidase domain
MLKHNLLIRVLYLLHKKDRTKFFIITLFQTSLLILDVAGVFLMGILGSLGFNSASSSEPGARINSFLELLKINNYNLQTQCTIIGMMAASALILKTILSIFVTRKILFFLSTRAAQTTQQLTNILLQKPLLEIQNKSLQANIYLVTSGVNNIVLGILGSTAMLISDTLLLVFLLVALFIAEPSTAIISLILFGGVLYVLFALLQKKAKLLGIKQANLSIRSSELLREVLSLYRQSVVSGRRSYYSNEVGIKQANLARINAEVSFFPNISKYSLEIVVVVSTLIIAALQFLQSDAKHAITVISIYLAASTRIAPAILRLQQNLISIKTLSGSALETLEFAENLNKSNVYSDLKPFTTIHDGFIPIIKVENVSMIYPESTILILDRVSFLIKQFTINAIVGKSGAGKTTLVDIILGIHNPTSGTVTISGVSPKEAVIKWPGAIAYVPQEVKIVNGTLRDNIVIGYQKDEIDEKLIMEAIENARLNDFVISLPNGLDTYIGDNGAFLSGGQKQRLGVARALLTKPKLLVLDEATNAMDLETEAEFFRILQRLQKEVTILMIAHGTSAAMNSNTIINLVNGEITMQDNVEYITSKKQT